MCPVVARPEARRSGAVPGLNLEPELTRRTEPSGPNGDAGGWPQVWPITVVHVRVRVERLRGRRVARPTRPSAPKAQQGQPGTGRVSEHPGRAGGPYPRRARDRAGRGTDRGRAHARAITISPPRLRLNTNTKYCGGRAGARAHARAHRPRPDDKRGDEAPKDDKHE